MKSKDIIDILNNIEELLKDKKYKEIQEYINTTKINVMANESKIENYIDDILSDLE